jgi:hypothetical protein
LDSFDRIVIYQWVTRKKVKKSASVLTRAGLRAKVCYRSHGLQTSTTGFRFQEDFSRTSNSPQSPTCWPARRAPDIRWREAAARARPYWRKLTTALLASSANRRWRNCARRYATSPRIRRSQARSIKAPRQAEASPRRPPDLGNHTRQRKAETSANRRRAVPWSMSIVPVSRWAMSSAPSLCSFVRSRSIASICRGLEVRIAE